MKMTFTVYGVNRPCHTVNDYDKAVEEAQEIMEQDGWACVSENLAGTIVWDANDIY